MVEKAKKRNPPHMTWDDITGESAYYAFVDAASKHDALGVMSTRARRQRPPELDLLEAILQDAMLNMNAPDTKKNRGAREDAIAWFRSDSESSVFSFVNICGALNISHTKIRERVFASSVTRKIYRKSDSYWKHRNPRPRMSKFGTIKPMREDRIVGIEVETRGCVDDKIETSDDNGSGRLSVAG